MPQPKKTLFTLSVGNYAPRITEITFPLMRRFADKIGADFYIIKERKFPEWPITFEKMQIFNLGREMRNDWNWFLDADTLVSPEMFDVTEQIQKNTICHNGRDFAGIRWSYDDYFRRDGRNWGSCNWCSVASEWCLDLWHPLEDLTLEQALKNIHVTIGEHNSGVCEPEHLIDDYTLSRNVARYGLKATTIADLCGNLGWRNPAGQGVNGFLWHKYTISNEQKVKEMKAILKTANGQPAFCAEGELIRDGYGNPVIRTKTGEIVAACGIGWGLD